ncbi:MAG: BON domain-containing protein [Candidatus Binatia bacterium]
MGELIKMSVIVLALGVGFAACDRADEGQRSEAPGQTANDKMAGPTSRPETPPANDKMASRPDTPAAKGGSPTEKTDAKMSNSDLENAVKAKLTGDEQLRTADLKVDANADKNEVTISGTVKSQDQRNKAIELAKSAHSGVTVNDKIDVKPAA